MKDPFFVVGGVYRYTFPDGCSHDRAPLDVVVLAPEPGNQMFIVLDDRGVVREKRLLPSARRRIA